jgi:hypothetical protein
MVRMRDGHIESDERNDARRHLPAVVGPADGIGAQRSPEY